MNLYRKKMNYTRYKTKNIFAKCVWGSILFLLAASCQTAPTESSVNALLGEISEKYAPDKRIAIFDITARSNEQGTLVLKGETNLQEAHYTILDTLAAMQVKVVDSTRILPAVELGEKVWGLVTLSVIPMRKDPRFSAEMVSQTIMGTPIKLLDKKGGWYLIQTPDKYLGWAFGSGLTALTEKELNNWKAAQRFVFMQSSGSVVAHPANDAPVISDLVLGSIFEGEQAANSFLKVKLPDGRQGYVSRAYCVDLNRWQQTNPSAERLIKTAKSLLGHPYLWGGTSSKGIDCSGFTKTTYFAQGVMLARDASQQALYGEALDISKFEFQPGDLLFFGPNKNRVTHVGLYLGNDQFIHSSGRVRINSFNPDDENYEPARKKTLVAARRVLNSLNSGQIITIKNHPWYNK